mmetsp:Transcript_4009/g.11716  ORF Transcript_4009/g.11716 Transcript_4009/m.11716 type:complete len:312 (-) Transcript_4009:1301-2236(-)
MAREPVYDAKVTLQERNKDRGALPAVGDQTRASLLHQVLHHVDPAIPCSVVKCRVARAVHIIHLCLAHEQMGAELGAAAHGSHDQRGPLQLVPARDVGPGLQQQQRRLRGALEAGAVEQRAPLELVCHVGVHALLQEKPQAVQALMLDREVRAVQACIACRRRGWGPSASPELRRQALHLAVREQWIGPPLKEQLGTVQPTERASNHERCRAVVALRIHRVLGLIQQEADVLRAFAGSRIVQHCPSVVVCVRFTDGTSQGLGHCTEHLGVWIYGGGVDRHHPEIIVGLLQKGLSLLLAEWPVWAFSCPGLK